MKPQQLNMMRQGGTTTTNGDHEGVVDTSCHTLTKVSVDNGLQRVGYNKHWMEQFTTSYGLQRQLVIHSFLYKAHFTLNLSQ